MKREEFWLGVCIYIILTIPTFAGPVIQKLNANLLNVSFYPRLESFFHSGLWELDGKLKPRTIADQQLFKKAKPSHASHLLTHLAIPNQRKGDTAC